MMRPDQAASVVKLLTGRAVEELRFLVITGYNGPEGLETPPHGSWTVSGETFTSGGQQIDLWVHRHGYEYGAILVVDDQDNEAGGGGRRPYKWGMDYEVFEDFVIAQAFSDNLRAAAHR